VYNGPILRKTVRLISPSYRRVIFDSNKNNITNKFVVQTSVTAHALFFFNIISTTKPSIKLPYPSTYLPSIYYQTRITKFNLIHSLKF